MPFEGKNYLISERAMRRVALAVRAYEAGDLGGGDESDAPVPDGNWQHIRVTGAPREVCGSGSGDGESGSGSGCPDDEESIEPIFYSPGVVVHWDALAEEEIDYGRVWLRHLDDLELNIGQHYAARQCGELCVCDDRRPVFVTSDAGTGDGGGGSSDFFPAMLLAAPDDDNFQLIHGVDTDENCGGSGAGAPLTESGCPRGYAWAHLYSDGCGTLVQWLDEGGVAHMVGGTQCLRPAYPLNDLDIPVTITQSDGMTAGLVVWMRRAGTSDFIPGTGPTQEHYLFQWPLDQCPATGSGSGDGFLGRDREVTLPIPFQNESGQCCTMSVTLRFPSTVEVCVSRSDECPGSGG